MLDVLAKKVWDMGEDPLRANAAKIAANMMITMAIEAMAEAVVLTEANGLPRDHPTTFRSLFGDVEIKVRRLSSAEARATNPAGFL